MPWPSDLFNRDLLPGRDGREKFLLCNQSHATLRPMACPWPYAKGGVSTMRPIQNFIGLILAALLLAGAAGDPSSRPDLNRSADDRSADDWLTVKVQTALYR